MANEHADDGARDDAAEGASSAAAPAPLMTPALVTPAPPRQALLLLKAATVEGAVRPRGAVVFVTDDEGAALIGAGAARVASEGEVKIAGAPQSY